MKVCKTVRWRKNPQLQKTCSGSVSTALTFFCFFFSLLYTILMWEALRGCRLQNYMKSTVSRICGIDSMFSFVICPCRGKNIEIMHVYLCRIWSKVLVLAVAVCSWRQWFMHTVFSSEMKNKNSHQISFLNLIIVMLLVETFFYF